MAFFWGQNVAKTVWRPGCAQTHLWSLQRSPRLPSCFSDGEGRGGLRKGWEGEESVKDRGYKKESGVWKGEGKRRKEGNGRRKRGGERWIGSAPFIFHNVVAPLSNTHRLLKGVYGNTNVYCVPSKMKPVSTLLLSSLRVDRSMYLFTYLLV